ncbi:FAD-dependent monooxygenase [Gammaproteobacteria bacterium]|jgi:salicylate hydroxylase|nr:FAD-dependent monooxygenase [Gammaproteobacteria bacterium]MDA9805480.1 FAD-dependent monooxygenase [Gammaproteobacteria bacterium]
MDNYRNHIAVIGGGISGLALGCTLQEAKIPVAIFEQSSEVSNYGAGISISPNGIKILKNLGIYQDILERSANPKNAVHFSNNKQIKSFDVDVITTTRKTLYEVLLNKYIELGGEILFNHKLRSIDINNSELHFSNNITYKVKHIAACDGIKSICRNQILPKDNPVYSGYSVWRSIVDKKQDNIETLLGPNHHIVTYPISSSKISFVAAVNTNKEYIESWKAPGSLEELKLDLPISAYNFLSLLDDRSTLYKWGVYTRPAPRSLCFENLTLLGDAAHPIVPFIGQGGCLALEDAYAFGKLICSYKGDIKNSQMAYENLRLPRIHKIKSLSERQGYLNHIKNPILVMGRNMIIKYAPSIGMRSIKQIWDYDIDKALSKIKH